MPEMSKEEIISVIFSINNSAPGYDDMPVSIIKKMYTWLYHPFDISDKQFY